jgi:four helix bundle protein
MERVAGQQIASVDSIHRNITEGYCRKSLKEYLQFLNVALSSTGESVSGLQAYHRARQRAEHYEFFGLLQYSIIPAFHDSRVRVMRPEV